MSRGWFRWPRSGGAEPTGRGAAPPDLEVTPEDPGTKRRRYSAEHKHEIVAAYRQSGTGREVLCTE
jgi:transposase-like protein